MGSLVLPTRCLLQGIQAQNLPDAFNLFNLKKINWGSQATEQWISKLAWFKCPKVGITSNLNWEFIINGVGFQTSKDQSLVNADSTNLLRVLVSDDLCSVLEVHVQIQEEHSTLERIQLPNAACRSNLSKRASTGKQFDLSSWECLLGFAQQLHNLLENPVLHGIFPFLSQMDAQHLQILCLPIYFPWFFHSFPIFP